MGVSYEFFGEFKISPPVTKQLHDEINGGWHKEEGEPFSTHTEGDYYPWEISDDGSEIVASGDGDITNVWDCDKDLARLVKMLAGIGYAVTGEIFAECSDQGENKWKYTVDEDGEVLYHDSEIVYDSGSSIEIERAHG